MFQLLGCSAPTLKGTFCCIHYLQIYTVCLCLQGSYKSSCFSSNMLRCEVGDLSGKHARLNVGSGKQFYTDPSLPLFGEMSGKRKTLTPTYMSIVSPGVLLCITKIGRKQHQTVQEKKNGFT